MNKKDIENLEEETKRREQVLKEKQQGREIERIELSRISKKIISIKHRILQKTQLFRLLSKVLSEDTNPHDKANKKTVQAFLTQIQAYDSIREDICITIEKKQGSFRQEFETLFPKITFVHETNGDVAASFLVALCQLMDIDSYLKRYLI